MEPVDLLLKAPQNGKTQTHSAATEEYGIPLNDIFAAARTLKSVAFHTPLQPNLIFSEQYGANIWFKREDLQVVRSYKLRGAYNKMATLTPADLAKGIVCASAGNHAQGVAWSCRKMKVHGAIYMPVTTPRQKIKQVQFFGKEYVEIILGGDTYDAAYELALAHCKENGKAFIHPFDDPSTIAGQATVGVEIFADADMPIDYLLLPVGGGGLSAGIVSYFRHVSPHTKIYGVEPAGAPAMKVSIEKGENTTLEEIDKFVDGAAVRRVGDLTFEICRRYLADILVVPEGKVCSTILKLYNESAIVAEPAGALSVAALDLIADEIRGKNVVCVLSGGNNDITRTEEIRERSMLYEGVKHYFVIRFAQRAGALREFVNDILGPGDDIVRFQFMQKNNRETGPALVGLEVKEREDFLKLIERMEARGINYEYLNDKPDLLQYLV
jgi:threonine dehydratase